MRAIYIAKGSPLLPPTFVSIFDDLASSSIDVFFDPSRALINLPGLTLGNYLARFLILRCVIHFFVIKLSLVRTSVVLSIYCIVIVNKN